MSEFGVRCEVRAEHPSSAYPITGTIVSDREHADAELIAAAPGLTHAVEALEAERDALRRQVAELTALGVSLHKAAAAGRDAGTAEAVAFLRLQAQAAGRMRGLSAAAGATIADAMLVAADTIERGEHVAKEDR